MIPTLTRFLELYDPLRHGVTQKGIILGLPATFGLFMPARGGVHIISMGSASSGQPSVDYDRVVGAVLPSNATPERIKNYTWIPWPASKNIAVGLRAVGKGGVEDDNVDQVVRFATDAGGIPVPLVPNPPVGLKATLRPNGGVLLTWRYSAYQQAIQPAYWNIYSSYSTGIVDYNNPYPSSRIPIYSIDGDDTELGGGAVTSGTTIKFVVRSVSEFGDEEQNTNEAEVTIDSTPPDVLPAPTISGGDEL